MMNTKLIIIASTAAFSVILAIVLLSFSLKKLTSTEYGLEYDKIAKILDDAAKSGGLHTGPPGFEFIKFPSTFILEVLPGGNCVSQDGLRVQFQVSFQYQMPREWLKFAVVRYRNFEKWQQVVAGAGHSAVQHSCAQFTISNFQNKRGIIQATMEDNIRLKLEGPPESLNGEGGVYARAISVQLQNVQVPSEYTGAISEKQSAEEDITLAINQRTQELTKANTEFLTAKEDARKIMDTARNEASVLLTEASLKAEETTFIFERESEIIVRVKNALNLTSLGVLAYMSNKLYETTPTLRVSMREPARSSNSDEL